MRLDRPTITLGPRTTVGCLDMAVMFFGRDLRPLLGIWLIAALPCCVLVYFVSRDSDVGLWMPALVVLFGSVPLGVLQTSAVCDRAFGRPFSVWRTVRRTIRYQWSLVAAATLARAATAVGLVICLIPGVLIPVRFGFLVERKLLARSTAWKADDSADDFVKAEFGELVLRGMLIFAFCVGVWLVLFVTVDLTCQLLFGFPILLGRIAQVAGSYYPEEYIASLLWYDPRVHTALTATSLLVYTIGRVAWFFCYIDVQVRRDCWDIQVQFLQEAKRLEAEHNARRSEEAA